MAKKKIEKTVTLEHVLFNCRTALRGIGGTDKNRDAVIALVFLKFAGDKFEKRRLEIIKEHGENQIFLEKDSFYRAKNVFYLPETSRWSYIVKNASNSKIAIIIDTAMKEIEDRNEPLKGTLPQNSFSTLGAPKESLKNLIDEINKIDEKQFNEEDLIGRVYEYFLQAYAVAGTKDDGEFYTPACVVKLLAELIEPFDGVVYDPCCGSGGMFVQSLKFVENHHGNRNKVSIIGQESQLDTWRLAKMNLAIRGIAHDLGKKNDSTFNNDLHKDKTVNYIMANPPFNLKLDKQGTEQEVLDKDLRFEGYPTPRVKNANYAWILHILSKLDATNGIGSFLLANGALNDGDDVAIRKEIIAKDKIEAIIVLPRDMFYTTDISVTLWIVNNNKTARSLNERQLRDRSEEIFFVDLRTWNTHVEEYSIDKNKKKKKVVFTDEQIEKIKELYFNWQDSDTSKYADVAELCKSVRKEEIFSPNYSLAPSNYIKFIDKDLDIDYEKEMARIQKDMKSILEQEKKSQVMLENAFKGIGYGIE